MVDELRNWPYTHQKWLRCSAMNEFAGILSGVSTKVHLHKAIPTNNIKNRTRHKQSFIVILYDTRQAMTLSQLRH